MRKKRLGRVKHRIKNKKVQNKKHFGAGLIFIAAILLAVIFLFFSNAKSKGWEGFNDALPENYSCKDCNVIVISITNLRNDHLGYNGYFRDTTPNIDKLAANSLVFENAFSHASWTLPVGISFFTSLYPFTHKVMNRWTGQTKLRDNIITLPEILEKQGYTTTAFTGGFDYNAKYGLISRFRYGSYPKNAEDEFRERYGTFEYNVKNAIKWMKEHKNDRFMLFYQGFNAHCPFVFPNENKAFDRDYSGDVDFSDCLWTFEKVDPVLIKNKTYYNVKTSYSDEKGYASVRLGERDIYQMVALYDGEISNADKVLQQFLDEIINLGLEDNTIIVLFSEHGDMFGEHGRFMRGGPLRGTFYDDVLHVPLLIKHPTLKPKRIDGLAQLIDVTPTLLDFLGIPKEGGFQGKSLVPLIMENKTVNHYVLAGSKFTPPNNNLFFNQSSVVQMIRTKDFKLINEKLFGKNNMPETDSYEFYNLRTDPKELTNVYSNTTSAVIDSLKARLDKMERRWP